MPPRTTPFIPLKLRPPLSIRPRTLSSLRTIAPPIHPRTPRSQHQPKTITYTYPPLPVQSRFHSATSTGKSQGDLIVEELQELYETAKDEFEIATESTDGATIYAASDRESARDALDQLLTVYAIYTEAGISAAEAEAEAETKVKAGGNGDAVEVVLEEGKEGEEGEDGEEDGRLVELGVDPAEISDEVREEVKRRVGQRIRELRSAVEGLEGRAKAD